ncbi:MAG: hypothetical protein KGI27_13985, partial [Thaumarchaeota archaeon]|nr:hypothetical protein [Nitrososphaerota archaeon]
MENVNNQERPSGLYNRWNFELAKLAPKEDNRYMLSALLVEPGATVETDGHHLVKVTTPNHGTDFDQYPKPEGFSTIRPNKNHLLPRSAALDIAKNCPRKQSIPVLENAAMLEQPEGQIGFVTTDLETAKPVVVKETKGQFPNYQAYIPNDGATLTIGFNAQYMADLCSFMAKAGNARSHAVKMEFYGPDKPVKMTAKNPDTGQEITAVLMPM